MEVYYVLMFALSAAFIQGGASIFVDKGDPYSVGPLEVGELTLSESVDNSPKHCKVFFPLEAGEYATVYFVGGLNSLVLAEFYSIVLRKIAEHGFFVFGVDYDFPLEGEAGAIHKKGYGQDINIYFEQLAFFKKYVKTVAVPRYDRMGLLCHSSGCDVTLRMIEDNRIRFNATGFLEPYSMLIRTQPKINDVPAFMYGTELAEVGPLRCNIPGFDYKQLYSVWKCPKVEMEVADFGHCDMLDPIPWDACRVTRFCTPTKNVTGVSHYRQVVHGAITSFFMTTLQGRPDAISYISNENKVPIKLLIDQSDLSCLNKTVV